MGGDIECMVCAREMIYISYTWNEYRHLKVERDVEW